MESRQANSDDGKLNFGPGWLVLTTIATILVGAATAVSATNPLDFVPNVAEMIAVSLAWAKEAQSAA
jgi:hypothetical protein